jgi:hypothetical protein
MAYPIVLLLVESAPGRFWRNQGVISFFFSFFIGSATWVLDGWIRALFGVDGQLCRQAIAL